MLIRHVLGEAKTAIILNAKREIKNKNKCHDTFMPFGFIKIIY